MNGMMAYLEQVRARARVLAKSKTARSFAGYTQSQRHAVEEPTLTVTRCDGHARGRDIYAAANALEEWLDIQISDDSGEMAFTEDDIDDLRAVSSLALVHASEDELGIAVHQAREVGWGWPPLALALGLSVTETRSRYESRL